MAARCKAIRKYRKDRVETTMIWKMLKVDERYMTSRIVFVEEI